MSRISYDTNKGVLKYLTVNLYISASTLLPVLATPFFIHLQDSFSSVKTSLGEKKMDSPSLLLEQYPQEALQADLH